MLKDNTIALKDKVKSLEEAKSTAPADGDGQGSGSEELARLKKNHEQLREKAKQLTSENKALKAKVQSNGKNSRISCFVLAHCIALSACKPLSPSLLQYRYRGI